MRIIPAVLLVSSVSAQAAECFYYSAEVMLRGVLSKRTFSEQPNYESMAKGDAKASYFFVSPHSPFCVAEGDNSDGLEPPIAEIKRVQLVFASDKDSYGPLRPDLGREVVCHGSLFHSISGHHHSPLLLADAKCSSIQ